MGQQHRTVEIIPQHRHGQASAPRARVMDFGDETWLVLSDEQGPSRLAVRRGQAIQLLDLRTGQAGMAEPGKKQLCPAPTFAASRQRLQQVVAEGCRASERLTWWIGQLSI